MLFFRSRPEILICRTLGQCLYYIQEDNDDTRDGENDDCADEKFQFVSPQEADEQVSDLSLLIHVSTISGFVY